MTEIEGIDKTKIEEFNMHFESNRLASFKDWPFEDEYCLCTPDQLAQAGFYHIPTETEQDSVRCFMCLKELDGWEPMDDPWNEHKKHAPKCPFVMSKKKAGEETVAEFLKSVVVRQQLRVKQLFEKKIKEFQQQAADTRKEMELLGDLS